jgi:hypothetical protein
VGLVQVDDHVPDEVLAEIRSISAIRVARVVEI